MPINPTIQPKIEPVLLDRVLDDMAAALLVRLPFLNNAYGKSSKHFESLQGRETRTPVIYTRGLEYLKLLPDSHLGNFIFFDLDDGEGIKDFGRQVTSITARLGLVFWGDLRTIYPDDWQERTPENVKFDILQALEKLRIDNGAFRILSAYNEADNIYKTYTHREIDRQFLMRPFIGFRIELELKYNKFTFCDTVLNINNMIQALTTAERDAIVNPNLGDIIYNTDTTQHEFFDGVNWVLLSTAQPNNLYTKSEVDGLLTNYYEQSAVNNLLLDYYQQSAVNALLLTNKNEELKEYSAQFLIEGNPVVNIQHWGTFEQRSANILDFLDNTNKTLSNDDFDGTAIWNIANNINGNFFTFPNLGDRRLNIMIHVSIICTSPPFDKGAVLHLKRGLNGTIVDDRSRSTIFQNFSTINPGAISFDMYTLAQGATDPYYSAAGGFGMQLENVTSTNGYNIVKVKLDCKATIQQV